ncbi:hypothetical protein MKD34_01550 [Cetobacterium somerae]|uniref:hypothetical protein n=1 Tax=Cetobacterium somerae TaxID=188913 RepID=UPI001F066F1C|nr:hypothetical protein [Cetobacterium somerae]UPO97556.1 hypothetical protein MKD34_01550 [Cetobacterium somerae]
MKKVYFILFFLAIFNSALSIAVYPKEFKKDITKGSSETFLIINDSNEKKLYKVSINIDEEKINYKIFPKVFILNPDEKKEVKIFLKPSSNTEIKNIYSGVLSIETLPINLTKYNNLKFNIHMDILAYVNKKPLI